MVYSALSDSTTTSQFTRRKKIHINSSADGALTAFQIKLTIAYETVMQADFEDIRFSELDGSYIYHWIESKTDSTTADMWIKTDVPASDGKDIYILYGNSLLSDGTDGENTFEFFDDFTGEDVNYITNWTKHTSNPLQTKTCQNWLIAVYSNYNNEDKIYIFEQRNAHPSNNIECWSFTRANASTPVNWTDHGVIFTGSSAHDDGHIEPHGIFFETQSMSDAREGVGEGLGTPKWRLYYCAKGDGEAVDKYSDNFIYASESDLTSWTAYSSNPVYDHDSEWGFADSKVCIYDDKVWLHHCKYKPGTSCDPSFFSVSDDGISSWTDKTTNWHSERTVLGTLVPFDNGILLTGNPATPDRYAGYFTTDGDTNNSYSSNPILSLGAGGQWDDADLHWLTIVIDKNGSANLNSSGTYYMYYIGYDGSTNRLGLATSTTLTEESEPVYTKWNLDGTPEATNDIITIVDNGIHCKDDFGMNHIHTFRAKAASPVGGGNWDGYGMFGWDDSMDTDTPYEDFMLRSGYSSMFVLSGAAYSSDLGSAMLDTWATYDIIRKATSHEFLIDDVSKHTESSPSTADLSPTFWSSTAKEKIEIDWSLVRKYTPNEPTTSIGTEQHQRRIPVFM